LLTLWLREAKTLSYNYSCNYSFELTQHVCHGRLHQRYGRTDRQTGRLTIALPRFALRDSWRVRAGPSLQLGTLSTRIANLLCIILSALSRLSCHAYARRPCYARHTLSGLAALRLTPRLFVDSADRLTRDRRTAAVLPVPSCKLGTRGCVRAEPSLQLGPAIYSADRQTRLTNSQPTGQQLK